MKKSIVSILLVFVTSVPCFASTPDVVEVDFLKDLGLEVNGAGPLLVKADPVRNRVVLVNTYTSSISLIDGASHAVENIPIQSRVPQYLKQTAMTIHSKTGSIYVIGDKSIHVVFPRSKNAISVKTDKQHEMIAVDEATGNAFFVGREDKRVGFLNIKSGKIRMIRCFDREEKLVNLNATPPPSIRKVVCDSGLKKAFVLDGFTATLHAFSTETGKKLSERKLNLKEGTRWHFAGYSQETHALYVAIETGERRVVQAAKIDAAGENDETIDLPGLTEGVGVNLSAARDEVYIPYDNHASVHVVDFNDGSVVEVKLPAYGNDASAVDEENDRLYVTSWAYGEIDVINLNERKLVKRVKDAGILPHMFSIAFNPTNGMLTVPVGATAVNGSFGAAVTVFDTENFQSRKIHTGWAPIDLIQVPGKESFLVFSSEDQFAEVLPDGSVKQHSLPVPYPRCATAMKNGNPLLSYGPHQSYWPTVYIWASRNGFLELEPKPLDLPDNRLGQTARIALDHQGPFRFCGVRHGPYPISSVPHHILVFSAFEVGGQQQREIVLRR